MWVIGSAAVLLLGWMAWGLLSTRGIEEPGFRVLDRKDGVELRAYAPHLVAMTEVSGDFRSSINEGFRRLARYLFGGNAGQQEIKMTAPVSQQRTRGDWLVMFSMPSKYTLETLPRPLDERVHLESVPSEKVAALRFPGRANEGKVEKKKAELLSRLERQRLHPRGEPVLALYNPPWTPPFLRRNEILIEVE